MANSSGSLRLVNILLKISLLANVALLVYFYQVSGSVFSWHSVTLTETRAIELNDWLAGLQFFLFAMLLDLWLRRSVLRFNQRSKKTHIPKVVTQIVGVVIYGFIGLAGFIILFEHSLKMLLAASGAIGLAASYALKDWIAGVLAYIEIQFDRLLSIGDWVDLRGKHGNSVVQVVQIDRRMVTLKNHEKQTLQLATTEFINGNFVNLTKQGIGCRRVVALEIDAQYEPDRILNILKLVVQYLIKTRPEIYDYCECHVNNVTVGHISYQIKYECHPSMSATLSNGLVMKTVLRFMASASVNLEAHIHIDRAVDPYDNNTRRLLEIRQQGILKVMRLDEILNLAGKVRRRDFAAGDEVVCYQAVGDSMFFVSEGALKVFVPDDAGQQMQEVGALWPGECFGEMSLLTGAARSASVVAQTDVVVLEVAKDDIAPLLASNPRLAGGLAEMLAQRVQHNAAQRDNTPTSHGSPEAAGFLGKILARFNIGA